MPFLVPEASSSGSSGGLGSLLILAIPILLIGWMFMSQRRRRRDMESMQASLDVGDDVSTTSGLHGRIVAMDDAIVTLEISPGVDVRFDRRAVLRKPAPSVAHGDSEPSTD
jgi:preprotein translocase subunit YajC